MKKAVISLAVIVVVLFVVSSGYYVWKKDQGTQVTVQDETAEEREEAVREAFATTGATADVSDKDAMRFQNIAKDLFARMARAIDKKSTKAISEVFATEAMYDYTVKAKLMKPVPRRSQADFSKGLGVGLANGIMQTAGLQKYEDVQIMKIQPINESEFIAYTRMWDDEIEVFSKVRWWIIRTGKDSWGIYDYEDFDMNIRASAMIGAAMTSRQKGNTGWGADMQTLNALFNGATAENLVERLQSAEKKARSLAANKKAPKSVQSYGQLMLISSLVTQEKFKEAMKELEVMVKEYPDVHTGYYLKGAAHQGLEEYDKAIESFSKYGDTLGWDSDVHEMIADCYLAKEDPKKALEHAKKGLDDNPKALGCVASFALATEGYVTDQTAAYIRKTSNPESSYEFVIDTLIENEMEEGARRLVEALRADHPQSELLQHYDGELADPETSKTSANDGGGE